MPGGRILDLHHPPAQHARTPDREGGALEQDRLLVELEDHVDRALPGGTVCISGAIDYVISRAEIVSIDNGHSLMPRVTGLGCTATALCGAFAAINPSGRKATAHAMAAMGIAGEMAAENATGPATFQTAFIDSLYRMKAEDIAQRLKAGTAA